MMKYLVIDDDNISYFITKTHLLLRLDYNYHVKKIQKLVVIKTDKDNGWAKESPFQ